MEVERTKAGIEAALTRWASLRRKKGRIEAEQTKELAHIRERFERESAPILAKFAPKLTPVEEELRQLEAAIRAAVLGATEKKGGAHKFPRVATDTAAAEITSRTEREVDAHEFFKLFTLPQRDSRFWGCFKVLVGKAEKLLGSERLAEVAHSKQTHSVSITEL